ncbi:CDP-glycerol glycerophosphotransferase family protein [Xenorhabdus sp. XENO-7]|uniref:CDP-glycerol glycerophosphotransferase family protein n=1 Tax=Xenorhabdus aichiensis TaxID=3025874 RepID=A0ABT5LY37_9GAMM|nr:CDP-glycerol glycerophosphotransferase family protein [Xenorhabdus aichiensis]MDC9620347.1 CDP-glycerol glycerophosphotransferase family protein [Xenorhabdus aichiensis]
MKKIFNYLFCFTFPLLFRPKKELAIFTFDKNNFKFNTKALFEYTLKENVLDVKYIINNDKLREGLTKKYGNKFITTKKIRDIIQISSAKIWITDGGFPLKTPFGHKNRILINLWHGIPLKKIGIMGYSGLSKLRIFLTLKMFAKHYTLFSSTSPNLSSIYSKSFLINKDKIKSLGQPRNDALFEKNNSISDYISDLPEYKKVILYAPTWRAGIYGDDWVGEDTKFFPFQNFKQNELEKYLEKNKILLCLRPHHLQKTEIKNSKWIKDFSSNTCNEIMEVIGEFDLLITDYSSIYFDFLILNKPILFLPYDLKLYEKNVGLNFDYQSVTPGPKPTNQNEFIFEISKLLSEKDYFRLERNNVNDSFNTVKHGNCQRIHEFIIKNLNKDTKI